jgi:hypothetical protein
VPCASCGFDVRARFALVDMARERVTRFCILNYVIE